MDEYDLRSFNDEVASRHAQAQELVDQMDPAPSDTESTDLEADVFAEAVFLRSFAAFEVDLESLFLHYVTGGASLNGVTASSYLNVKDEGKARALTRAGWRYLSWAKPQQVRETAENYMSEGWPISAMLKAKAQDLSDCERVRNRIAHHSPEAEVQFGLVQRNWLQTERLFTLSPGQFLRIRSRRLRTLHLQHYLQVMNETLCAIMDPPP